MNEVKKYCGFIAIIGRSNVGKSTLLNKLIGHKISITSHKKQTTNYNIIGINTENFYQAIYIDTPGFIIKNKYVNSNIINNIINNLIKYVNLIIFVVEGTYWMFDDKILLQKLNNITCPVLLVINKIDHINNKSQLLPHISFLSKKMNFLNIIPISAKKEEGINIIINIVKKCLPQSKHYFSNNFITDQSHIFIASEIIREKFLRFVGGEIPYHIQVNIEKFMLNKFNEYKIDAIILVKRKSQKKIIIGNNGNKLKIIGVTARQDMEKIFCNKVHLKLWIKVKFN
ncbi:GTPase Era [Serratia symbiotica]|nr:GTPase Era [Serratia symbiotica]